MSSTLLLMSSTLLQRLSRPNLFIVVSDEFCSVENTILNISSPTLAVTLSSMIPEGLKLDQNDELEIVKQFILAREQNAELKNQLHVIW
jgi:hypothetical protein